MKKIIDLHFSLSKFASFRWSCCEFGVVRYHGLANENRSLRQYDFQRANISIIVVAIDGTCKEYELTCKECKEDFELEIAKRAKSSQKGKKNALQIKDGKRSLRVRGPIMLGSNTESNFLLFYKKDWVWI